MDPADYLKNQDESRKETLSHIINRSTWVTLAQLVDTKEISEALIRAEIFRNITTACESLAPDFDRLDVEEMVSVVATHVQREIMEQYRGDVSCIAEIYGPDFLELMTVIAKNE